MEEAFYLYHSLGCIKILGEDNCIKNDDQLWKYMIAKRENFPDFYKAYSHLRMKNWVVRSGSQYGADFIAYRHHPSLVHSEYAVLVLAEEKGDANGRLRVWSDFQCTLQLCGGVVKTLLVLHVVKNGRAKNAKELCNQMKEKGFVPSSKSYNSLVNSLALGGEVDEAVKYLWEMIEKRRSADFITYRTVLDGIWRHQRVEDGVILLKDLQEKDIMDFHTYKKLRYELEDNFGDIADRNRISPIFLSPMMALQLIILAHALVQIQDLLIDIVGSLYKTQQGNKQEKEINNIKLQNSLLQRQLTELQIANEINNIEIQEGLKTENEVCKKEVKELQQALALQHKVWKRESKKNIEAMDHIINNISRMHDELLLRLGQQT